MKYRRLIESLKRFQFVLPALVRDISGEDAAWKPASGNWSILEIVCHLLDEEVMDFRPRIQSTLAEPGRVWPAIDPESWAIEESYNSQELAEKTEEFVAQRKKSVEYLDSLASANWDCAYQHPQIGPIRAGDLLAAWTAHDHLHARQISKRLFEVTQRDAAPYVTSYAGEWTA